MVEYVYLSGLGIDVEVEVAVDELDRDQGAAGEDHVVSVGNVVANTLIDVGHVSVTYEPVIGMTTINQKKIKIKKKSEDRSGKPAMRLDEIRVFLCGKFWV